MCAHPLPRRHRGLGEYAGEECRSLAIHLGPKILTMKAAIFKQHGKPEVLEYADVADQSFEQTKF
jgi:hypothetical protein